jgi:23S rRNA pseudouridine1911/1915/1917 synthase
MRRSDLSRRPLVDRPRTGRPDASKRRPSERRDAVEKGGDLPQKRGKSPEHKPNFAPKRGKPTDDQRGDFARGRGKPTNDQRGQRTFAPKRGKPTDDRRGFEPKYGKAAADQRDDFAKGRGRGEDSHRRPIPGSEPRRGHKAIDPAKAKGVLWVPGPNARLINVEAGMDLGHFLVNTTKKSLSVRAARRHLANGCCRINGQVETYGSRILQRGEIVEFFIPEDREHHFDKKRILLDDVGVFAYDKPAFLPVTPTDAVKSWSLVDILTAELGELFPVHRLDADTSGIVLFARSKEVATRLETLFKNHAVEKTYHAIVRGHPREQGEHRSYLVKSKTQPGFETWKSGRGPDAREAITTWEVEERLGTYGSLVRIHPKTGRHHQIRIHFSEMDFPLYGDRLYGDRRDPIHVTRQFLHASRIQLPHPISGPSIDISCRLPREFQVAAEQLRKL